jgi:hypothetical protein
MIRMGQVPSIPKSITIFVLNLCFLCSCIIEVGNPVTETGKGGSPNSTNMKLLLKPNEPVFLLSSEDKSYTRNNFAQDSFNIKISRVAMLGYDDYGAISTVYAPKQNNYDLYSSEKNLVLTEGYAKPGTYDMIILQLDKKSPFTYFKQGLKADIGFSDSSYESIYIKHKFVIGNARDMEQVIIDFNLLNSISQKSDEYIFNPKYKAFSVSDTTHVSETISKPDGALYACAYLTSNIADSATESMPKPKAKSNGDGFSGFGPGVYAKVDIKGDSSKDMIKQDTTECESAYDIRKVSPDGSYDFPYLQDGSYIMRVIYEDGSDQTHRLTLKSGNITSSLGNSSITNSRDDIDVMLENFLKGSSSNSGTGASAGASTDEMNQSNDETSGTDTQDDYKDLFRGLPSLKETL